MNSLIFRLAIELKKVGGKFFIFLGIGIPFVVFLITCAFLLLNTDQLAKQPMDIVIGNNIGAWSALIYPLVLLVLVQNLVDVETKGNMLTYSKSYKKNWIDLFLWKVFVALLILILTTLSNIIFNYGLVKLTETFMISGDNQESTLSFSISFLKLIPALIPAIFFHLMLCFIFRRAGVAYLIGMILIIIGIPIANLTNFSVIPYSFGVVVLNPNGHIGTVAFIGFLTLLLSPLITDFMIKR